MGSYCFVLTRAPLEALDRGSHKERAYECLLSINRPLVSARNGLLDGLALRNERDRDTVDTVAFGARFEAFVAEHVTQVPASHTVTA
jgi:hypothetical protein